MKNIIFDFGSNQGQNISYYLDRADIVVCVEANLKLCEKIKNNFSRNIELGELFVENYAVSSNEKDTEIFYVNKIKNTQSQLPIPKKIEDFIKTEIKTVKASTLIKKYLKDFNINKAHYIKIDVEYMDHIILKDILSSDIEFDFISCEAQGSSVLIEIIKSKLKYFKILIGSDVKNLSYKNKIGENINFTHHSAGPFGDDIDKKWINKTSLITYFINNGLGWKDICCTYNEKLDVNEEISYNKFVHNPPQLGFFFHLKRIFPEFLKSFKNYLKKIFKFLKLK